MDAGLKTYVSSLNEFAQKKGWSVHYDLVNTDGQEHMKTFTMRVVMNGKSYHGVGQNKEEAGQNAAKNALHALTNDEPINTVSDENASREDNLNQSSSNTRPSTPAQLAWSESSDSGLISQSLTSHQHQGMLIPQLCVCVHVKRL
ncbi:ribonuclease 3-like [Clarias gariepinus]|uniref:ribonuclease 3-like n=1 Tax=Clarias gariepinus TaxID=13013 RepID=UPI00234E333A|nr:ribonuclease 3-like [Clarias gariepinus]